MKIWLGKEFLNRRVWSLLFDFKKNTGLPLIFLLLIFMPLADQVLHLSIPVHIKEKRKLAQKPEFSLSAPFVFLKKYEEYFNDNFGWRSNLVYQNNLLTIKCFATSPLDKVIIGQQGWLFLAKSNKFNNEIDYYRSLKLFTPAELRQWRRLLRQRREWLRRRDIQYFFVVVPNKSTIYPEYMPANIRRLNSESRLDQLLNELRQEVNFPIIDLRDALITAKKHFRVFDKTDTHWNKLGAYFAYVKIMEKLAPSSPGLRALPLTAFTISSQKRVGGDLALMLSLQNTLFREEVIRLESKSVNYQVIVNQKRNIGPFITETISECPSGTLPVTMIVHDSFMHQLKPFFRPHCKRIIYIWDWELNFFKNEIAREKPEIVIDEMCERSLLNRAPDNPPELSEP